MDSTDIAPPRLDHVCDFDVELAQPLEMGAGRAGQRRIIPIIGGQAAGPLLSGEILNLGADWQTVYSGGLTMMDTRYGLRTAEGAVIEIINFGFRHGPTHVLDRITRGETVAPSKYYMRTHARLETGDARYAWVNRTLFVGTGARLRAAVRLRLFAIL